MDGSEHQAERDVTPRPAPEYTVGPSSRPWSARGIRRLVFFSLASIWGFIVGVGGFLAAMSVSGQPVHPSGGALSGLIPGLIVAAAGGLVIAAAYRESKHRSR
jgi:hypothetical protein